MHRLVYPAILIALAASSAIASAQQPVPANQRYCLEAGGGPSGGPHPLLCRFETLEQCFASKTAQGDACMLNPILAFQRR